MGTMDGQVAVVTGANSGIGKETAYGLASLGATVVLACRNAERAAGALAELRRREPAGALDTVALDLADLASVAACAEELTGRFGRLDVLVNNAGILRDRMLVNMTDGEWDAVIAVHLRGTFAPMRHAAGYWRDQSKAGQTNDARIINTTSPSGIYGNVGQTNYGAAKAGIAAMTIISSLELGRYGVTVNAIAPAALTRMTENLGFAQGQAERKPEDFDPNDPDNIAPLVVWLGSPQSAEITGRVFNVHGGHISVAEGWVAGPGADKADRWETEELGGVIPDLVARAAPNANMLGRRG